MAGSVDELLSYLLDEISLSGRKGCTFVQVSEFLDQFYGRITPKDGGLLENSEQNVQVIRPTVDDKLRERAWEWLLQHPNVRSKQEGKEDALSRADAQGSRSLPVDVDTAQTEAALTASTPTVQPIAADSKRSRLYVTKDRTWLALCGHPKDSTKLFDKEFELLGVIASRRDAGIIQSELIKVSGQDKRSVPKRTDALCRKGYIEKRLVFYKGARTSRLILERFVRSGDSQLVSTTQDVSNAAEVGDGDPIDVENLIRDVFTVLKKGKIVTLISLRTDLGFVTTRRRRLFVKAIRRLEMIGCLKRVLAASGTSRKQKGLFMSVKYVRDPTDKDIYEFRIRLSAVPDDANEDVEADDMDGEDEENGSAILRDGSQLQELARVIPQWNPDRVLVNATQHMVELAGRSGLTAKEFRMRMFGSFLRRPFENLLAKISECPFASQPPGLHHLAVLRDTVQSGTISLYVHYSVDNFRTRVETGDGFWEAVVGDVLGQSKSKSKGAADDGPEKDPQQLDQFGFNVANRPVGQVKGGRSTLGQALFAAQPSDLSFSGRDPSLAVAGQRSHLDRRNTVSGREVADLNDQAVANMFLSNAPPVVSEEREIKGYNFNDKPKGRPRKYVRGTEKFWREHFELVRAPPGKSGSKKKRLPAVLDPMTLPVFAEKPALFDFTLVQAIEDHFPVPDKPQAIKQEWVAAISRVLHRAAAGIYVTPRGVTEKTLGGKNKSSQIVIIRSLKLRGDSTAVSKPSFARFITSSAAHTQVVPRTLFLEEVAQQCRDQLANGPDPMPFQQTEIGSHTFSREDSVLEAQSKPRRTPTPKTQLGMIKGKENLNEPKVPQTWSPGPKVQSGVKRHREESASQPLLDSSHPSPSMTLEVSNSEPRLASQKDPDLNGEALIDLPESGLTTNTAVETRRDIDGIPVSSPASSQRNPEAEILSDDDDGEQDKDNAVAEKLIQELSASIPDQEVQRMQDEETHHQDTGGLLPKLIVEDVDKDDGPNNEGKRSGSLGIIRRKILLDLLKLSGHVLPLAFHNLVAPFGQLWQKAGQSGIPDTKTLKTIIKPLCQNGIAKKITFSFRNKRGLLVTKQMLVPVDKSLSDPYVLETQRKIMEADPGVWLPDSLAFGEQPPYHRSKYRWSETVDSEKVNTAEALQRQLREQLQSGKWPNKGQSDSKTRAQSRLKSLRASRLALQATRNSTAPVQPSVFTLSNPKTLGVLWGPDRSSSFPTSLEEVLQRATYQKRGRPSRLLEAAGDFSSFCQEIDKVARWEQRSTALFLTTSKDYQFIDHHVGREFLKSPSIQLPVKFDGLIWFDASGREHTENKFHRLAPVASHLAKLLNADASPRSARGGRKRKVQHDEDDVFQAQPEREGRPVRKRQKTAVQRQLDEQEVQLSDEEMDNHQPALHRASLPAGPLAKKRRKIMPDKPAKKPRRGKTPPSHPRTIVDVNGGTVDVSHLLRPKFKRPRGPQFLRKLPDYLKLKTITAVVVVRTLAGGLEKSISWDLVNRVFPDTDEVVIRTRFKGLVNNHRRDVASCQQNFQEKFPVAYARGDVGVVNFDDLDSVDWVSLVDWALKNLDQPLERDSGELPATKRRLDDLVNVKIEPGGRHYRDMFLYNQGVTIAMKEQATLNVPFAVPINISSASTMTPHLPDVTDEPDDPVERVGRSWALASITTPRSVYNCDEAQEKLRSLASTTEQSEAQIGTALKSLMSAKVIAKVRADHNTQGEGRRYVLSKVFHDALSERRTINAKVLHEACRYKLDTLDPAFQAGQTVRFDPMSVEDGDMVALLNLVATNRITLHPGPDMPQSRWGLDCTKVHKSRTISKELLAFSILISHNPSTYLFGNPLWPNTNPPALPTLGRGNRDPIPLWRHIDGTFNREKFDLAVSALLGVLATRPGASLRELARSLKVALGEWEIECLLEWARGAGVVGMIGGGDDRGEGLKGGLTLTGGWEVREWWWMVLDRRGLVEE